MEIFVPILQFEEVICNFMRNSSDIVEKKTLFIYTFLLYRHTHTS